MWSMWRYDPGEVHPACSGYTLAYKMSCLCILQTSTQVTIIFTKKDGGSAKRDSILEEH